MAQIRIIYSEEPNFPATDNSPDAVRYEISGMWVDAVEGEPTVDDVAAFMANAKG